MMAQLYKQHIAEKMTRFQGILVSPDPIKIDW